MKKRKRRTPELLQTTPCPIRFQAASEGGESVPKFEMTAYTGGAMFVKHFGAIACVIDLENMSFSQTLPCRMDHDRSKGVGHTTRVTVTDGHLTASGLISRKTSWARDVAESGLNGFPWKVSVGCEIREYEFLSENEIVTVNGSQFSGPLYIVRKSVVRELSFVDDAADKQTNAVITAKHTTQQAMTLISDQKNMTSVPDSTTEKTPENFEPAGTANLQSTPPATEVQAGAVTQIHAVDSAAAVEAAMRRATEAMLLDSRRIAAIEKIGGGRMPELQARAIEENWSLEKFQTEFKTATVPNSDTILQARNHSPSGSNLILEASALMSANMSTARLEARYEPRTLEAAQGFVGIGLQEFCQLACHGIPLGRFRSEPDAWLQAAFSSISLPGLLSGVANKMLMEGYDYGDDPWRKIVKIGQCNNFLKHVRYRLNGAFRYEKVAADGELKHGKLDEQEFEQKIDTHGIMFAITRQMMINDDLNAFTSIPKMIGLGAADAITDAVWSLLLSNPNNFFSAAHNNLLIGPETELKIDGLTLAEKTFMEQTRPNGRPLNVPPKILLVPPALKVYAEILMKSVTVNETTTTDQPKPNSNPHAGKYEIVSSPYLSSKIFKNASEKSWYLLADPNRLAALEVAFLGGRDRPTVERATADFNTLGVQFRGYLDFGVKEQDWRGALKMKGTA